MFLKNAYPQREFAEAAAAAVRAAQLPDGAEILDLPCGDGTTTFWLAQNFPHSKVTGVDIDPKKVGRAKSLFLPAIAFPPSASLWRAKAKEGCHSSFVHLSNLHFAAADIFDWLRQTPRLDALCLINSLFLLPDTDGLMRLIAEKMDDRSLFVCIIPNTASRNFQNFQRLQPQVNRLQISREEIEPFFARYGLRAVSVQGIVFQHFYGLLWPKLLGPLRHWALRRLHRRNSGRAGTEACYFLIVLRRNSANAPKPC